ncbi:sugar phosphate isomerase/epimerase family protein [Clavibacter sp. VKM Ac-2872]|uniref:sugar phosphate isomerase/epimerase family protein n=1 Tax=Clavibacter sp. VKM Ac-2872 TaxID=2783812 RepID=UPI00188CA68C|nr:sugar phosphate isomerase/epimerase [Clavibacter sp. VKM Ac-2872]
MSAWRSRLSGITDEGASGFAGQRALHARLGIPNLELRTFDETGLDRFPMRTHIEHAAKLEDVGLSVPVIDSPIGSWAFDIGRPIHEDLEQLSRFIDIARAYGSTGIRVMSYPNDGRDPAAWRDAVITRFSQLVAPAEEAAVTLLIENCDGWAGLSAVNTLDLLASVDSDALALIFDTGNGVSYGYDSVEFLQPVMEHVRHVHVKDSVRGPGGVDFVPVATGSSRVRECIELLEEHGYGGLYSIEPHVERQPHLGTSNADDALARSYERCMRDVERVLEGATGPRGAAA